MLNVKIDRLNIQLTGISPQIANILANDLGKDLLQEIAKSQTYHRNFPIKIDKIDLGFFNIERNPSYSDLKNTVVNHVTEAIHSRLNKKSGNGVDN